MVRINLSYQTESDGVPTLSSEQMTAFEVAARIWSTYLKDDVAIDVHIGMSNELPDGVIGGALPGTVEKYNFNHFKNDLRRDRTSQDDITAHANLTEHHISSGDDDDGGSTSRGFRASADGVELQKTEALNLTTAQAKALGLSVNSKLDGVIWMSDLSNLSSNQDSDPDNDITWGVGPTAPTGEDGYQIDFLSVAVHELGHILGFVSGADKYEWQQEVVDVSTLKNQGQLNIGPRGGGDDDDDGGTPVIRNSEYSNFGENAPVTPLDMFRYDPESKDLGIDLSVGGSKYFSIDGGKTVLAEFATGQSEELGGDGYQASHWKEAEESSGVMVPALSLNQRNAISRLDLRAFDVMGWDLADSLLGADGVMSEAEFKQTLDLSNPQTLLSIWQSSETYIQQNQSSLIYDRTDDVNHMIENSEVYEKKKNKKKKKNKHSQNGKWQELVEWLAEELGFSTIGIEVPPSDQDTIEPEIAEKNLVRNGSFEHNSIAPDSWGVQSSLEGWVQTLGTGVEVQELMQSFGKAAHGEAWLELDAQQNTGIAQEIDTELDKTYQLSFAYSPRPGISAESNQLAVYWDGKLMDTIIASGQDLSLNQWQIYTYDVDASSGDTTGLEFRAVGNSDGLGVFLDNVKVIEKDPGSNSITQSQNLATNHSFRQGLDANLSTGTLDFDGIDDYSQIDGLETGGAMTFSAWVNYDRFNYWSRIFDFGDGAANNNIILGNKAGTNDLGLHIYEGSQNTGVLEIDDFWQANTWTHVTATIDESGKIQVYKNGTLAGESTASAAPTAKVRAHNYIGKSHWSQDGAFDGQINDVFLLDDALNPTQVQALYAESYTEHGSGFMSSSPGENLDMHNGVTANLSTGILDFDGTDDYAQIQGVETGGAMTFSAWVNYDRFNHWSRVFDFGDGAANNNILLGNKAGTNTLGLHVFDGRQYTGILEIDNFWQVDTWTHVTASLDELGNIQVYKNGVLAGEAKSNVVPTVKVRTNYIGKSHWSQDGAFDGQLSNINLQGQSLNTAEVQALYKDAVVNLDSQQQGDNILNGTHSLTLGRGEQDMLVGSGATDTFILGDRTQAYYLGNGTQDYAHIQGFNVAQDHIQLHGSANYYQQHQQGDDLYLYAQGTTSDLVAVLENTAKLNLSNSAIFV